MVMTSNGHAPRRSADRYYPIVEIHMSGHKIPGHRLKCRNPECGFEGEILDRNTPPFASGMIERKFRDKGWEVGKNEKHDVCPKCVEAERVARRKRRHSQQSHNVIELVKQPQTIAQGETMNTTTAAEEAPREMSREDKRIVYGKINEVYIDQNKGYQAPWTDQAVAKDLGVPVSWISMVREEMFGAAHDNSEIRDLLDRAKTINQQAAGVLIDAKKLRDEAAELVKRCNTMNGTLTEIARAVETLNAATARIERAVKN